MKLLAINTAFSNSYVGVINGQACAYKTASSNIKQSENVLKLVDSAFQEVNMCASDLEAVACVIGPGSFTGIRIGASLAKGICTPFDDIKRIEINSLDLLAYTHSKDAKGDFWVVLNALSGNFFACKYDKFGKALIEPELLQSEEINAINGDIIGLEEEGLPFCNLYSNFSSEELILFAQNKVKHGKFSKDFVPLYIRKSQAEAELDKKNGNC